MGTALKRTDKRGHSLRFKIAVPFTILVILAVVVPGFIAVYESSKTLSLRTEENQMMAAQLAARHLEILLRGGMAAVEGIAQLGPLKSMDKPEIDKIIHEVRRVETRITSLIVMDADGKIISFVDKPHNVGKSLAMRDYFKIARNEGRSNFSDSILTLDKTITVVTAAPIRNDRDQIVGVLVGTFDVHHQNLNQVVLDTRVGKSGYAYLVDRKGIVIAHPVMERALKQENLSQYAAVREVIAGKRGISTYPFEGETMLAAYVPIQPSGWGVVVQQPIAEANAPAVHLRNVMLAQLAASVILAVLLGLFISYRITQPLSVLRSSAEAMGRGDLETPVLASGNDEIGIFARTFEKMRVHLKDSLAKLEKAKTELETEVQVRREAEERFRNLYDDAPVGYFEYDLQGNIIQVNRTELEMLGYTAEEMIGQPCWNFIVEDARGQILEKLAGTRPPAHNLERTYRRKDGTAFPVLFEDRLLTDENGRITGIRTIIQDITERKRSEEALRERDNLLKKLSIHVPGMIYQFMRRPDGTYCVPFASEAVKDIFGCFPEDVKEDFSPIARAISPEDLDRLMESVKSSAEHMTVWRREYRVQLPGGPVRWIYGESSPEKLADGSIIWHGFNRDITELKRAEASLRESEAQNRFLADTIRLSDQPFAVGYPDGRMGILNPAFCRLVGYSEEELGQMYWNTDLTPPEWRADEVKALAKLMETGNSVRYEKEYLHKDGRRIPVELLLHLVPDETGNPLHYYAFIDDLTNRKAAEQKRIILEAQLHQAQKMESVGRLAGGVAHDFNNKLTVMLGYAQMAMEGLDRADPLYGNLQEVMKAGIQSVGIVRQLLAFARKQIIAPEVLDLNETVEDMLKMLRRLIGEDIGLIWSAGHDLWQMKMDPSQVDQILANLCVNARDAIQGVGKVTIETRNTALNEAYCAEHAGAVPGEYVMLAVSDDGSGMDRETLENIFEPFFTTKDREKGTGLGLATVYGIVKQNNGFIDVESKPGRGTAFRIYLPRHGEEVEEKVEAVEAEIPQGRGETILIVEDDAPVLQLAQRVLENLGYAVLTSASPAAAITMVRDYQGEIHLLMTDVVLPEMSGKEVAWEISKIRPAIRTLYMSGYTADVIAHHGVLDDGVHFVGKPFTPDSLARKVREAIDSEK